LLVGFEFIEIENFESEIERTVGRSEFGLQIEKIFFEIGRRSSAGNELESELIGLPSLECIAENGDLAGKALDGKSEKEKEAHGLGAGYEAQE